ncbi:MAG: DUF3667 domain-containing protein [Steroidobacteraceae bacterium]
MSPEQSAAATTAGPPGGAHEAEPTGATIQHPAEPAPGALQHPTAAAVPRDTLQHPNGDASRCANCGASVPGKYCGQCGQRLEHEIHSVLHFAREATEDLTHADSRLWGTMIALLFKPGFLTSEFLSGRRARYLPPLRLYLVLSLLFFLVVASEGHGVRAVTIENGTGKPSVALVSPDDKGLAAQPGETLEQREKRVCNPDYDGPARSFVLPFLQKGCRHMVEDRGRTVSEAFMHNLPKAMFIFLPALALVMKAMYWRPRRYYVEHLLFFLHNHAFAFLIFGVLALLTRFVPPAVSNPLEFIVWLYVSYYVFVSMRRVYGQGRWLTFTKLVVLFFAYLSGVAVVLAMTALYSVYSV